MGATRCTCIAQTPTARTNADDRKWNRGEHMVCSRASAGTRLHVPDDPTRHARVESHVRGGRPRHVGGKDLTTSTAALTTNQVRKSSLIPSPSRSTHVSLDWQSR